MYVLECCIGLQRRLQRNLTEWCIRLFPRLVMVDFLTFLPPCIKFSEFSRLIVIGNLTL